MSVIKIKGIDSNFTMVPNEMINDNLSWSARGMLLYLCSKPSDWEVNISDLIKQTEGSEKRTGRDAVRNIINELVKKCYMRKTQKRLSGKFDNVDYEVSFLPFTEKPLTAKPLTANPTQQSKDIKQSKDNKRSLVPSETKRIKFKFNDNDLKLAEWMFSRVLVINPSAKKPNPENWANTVRLMREIDNRTHAEISGLFDWANKDSFWCSNILSPEKLRKQWDKLTVKRGSNEGHQSNSKLRQQATDGLSDSQRAIAAARAQRDGNTEASRPPMGSNGSVVYEQVGQDEWSDSQQLVVKGNSEPF